MLLPPEFFGPRVWHGRVGEPFSMMIEAGQADAVLVVGQLPETFTFDPQSRVLSGTPPSQGSFAFNFQATNIAGTTARAVVLFVDSLPVGQGVDYAGPCDNDSAHPRRDTPSKYICHYGYCFSPDSRREWHGRFMGS